LFADEIKRSAKYSQISASIAEIGLVEPPVVARSKFLLLDGHLPMSCATEVSAKLTA
jgi:ParB-like chromosome segregation protein Spo0J